jgi:MFS family permease
LLSVFRHRDFSLLWAGMAVSMLGDGFYYVALAWLAYDIDNSPTALSLVGVGWTLPALAVLPFSGALSDRLGRRPMMILADVIRAAAVAAIALLGWLGHVEIWHLVILSGLFGIGDSLFGPSMSALVPELVPGSLLVQANSVEQTMRPLMLQFVGPALGGTMVAAWGASVAFAVDSATFIASIVALALMRSRPPAATSEATILSDVRDGVRYVRSQTWLWGTLLAFCISVLTFWGPYEVLLPYLIRNDLHGGADGYGLVLAAGGVGSIAAALVLAKTGIPRHRLITVFLAFIVASLGVTAYGLGQSLWQMAAFSALEGVCFAIGLVAWQTLLQTEVPKDMLGRVNALDWMVSTALLPVSFALVGPVSAAIGVRPTLVACGVIASLTLVGFLVAIPGMRAVDRPHPSPTGT